MKKLSDILFGVKPLQVAGDTKCLVNAIHFDSRYVVAGALFVAMRGSQTDGHRFINKAIENGAVAVVCEILPEMPDANVVFIVVENSAEALGIIASAFYDHPSQKLKLVGVTGTNGKTTIATLLYMLHRKLGYSAGLFSTVENKINDEIISATHTTPDAVSINHLLAEMVEKGCSYCFMEVSSHAVDQHRIAGLQFAGGIFTNLTHDHLDYHGNFRNYLKAKKAFFDQLPKTAFALTNIDDKNGSIMLQNTKAYPYTYSIKAMADFNCRILESHFGQMLIRLNDEEIWVHLTGDFNAYNITAIYGAAICLGHDKQETLQAISTLHPVSGRFETIVSSSGIVAIVDYAHTPDALENVLNAINAMRSRCEQLITVVGCGGDRDRTKRPKMAEIACHLSDRVVLTSDNPRTEDPEEILDEMEKGIGGENYRKKLRITNRREAIRTAVSLAKKGDIILIAGKGHEKYQEINGVRNHFDDKEEAEKAFSEHH